MSSSDHQPLIKTHSKTKEGQSLSSNVKVGGIKSDHHNRMILPLIPHQTSSANDEKLEPDHDNSSLDDLDDGGLVPFSSIVFTFSSIRFTSLSTKLSFRKKILP